MSCWEAWYGLKTSGQKHKVNPGRVSLNHGAETIYTERVLGIIQNHTCSTLAPGPC